MTQFRVTERSISTRVLAGLQANISRLAETQERLSSGKQITRPSDSPTGTASAMQYRTEIAMTKQHGRNSDDGIGWLGTADNALTAIVEQVQRVRELVLQGTSAGSGSSPGGRAALAAETETLRAAMIGHANSTYLDRPIFGGTATGAIAYNSAGTFVGDTGAVERRVADNTKVRVDTNGDDVFGSGTGQLFTILSGVADNLRNGSTAALSADLDKLDAATAKLESGLAGVGARYNQLTRMRQVADDRLLELGTHLSDIEDIDLPRTLIDLQLQQTAYQAALAAGARVVQPSLMDFLR